MEAIPAFLLEYGLPGAAILVLGWFAFNRVKLIDQLNEKRLEDAMLLKDAINDNTRALEALTDLLRATGGPNR